jgi:cytochrome c oxidase assembly protein subunit 15
MKEAHEKLADPRNSSRAVATWLLIGAAMIVIQVLLGGITRLTESGLSITEWKPITGALPPMNALDWQAEFDKYKTTDQFKYVHQDFTISQFKYIFFWEWLHRSWARLMGLVFLVGFVYFLLKRKFQSKMILPIVILFFLGALQGVIGWLMVKSGLVPEKYFVGHIELATHFIAALALLAYTLWFAMQLLVPRTAFVVNFRLKNILVFILILVFVQLVYGAFMAGMRTAVIAPTWPDINGSLVPPGLTGMVPVARNFAYNPITIHFIHRGLAYLLLMVILYWWWRSRGKTQGGLFKQMRFAILALVCLQVLLGIFTVINSTFPQRLVWLGVLHQFTAMLLVMAVVALIFLTKRASQ